MRLRIFLRQEEGQIVRHLIIAGVIVAVVVFLLVEAGPIIWLRISSVQDAEDVANSAAFQYRMFKNEDAAIAEVTAKMQAMGLSDEEIRESAVVFLPPGSGEKTSVRVTVVRYADTLLTRRINPLKRFARVATSKEASVSTASGKQ